MATRFATSDECPVLQSWRTAALAARLRILAVCHIHHAVVLAVPAAARRQIRFTLRREREQRGGKGQTEDGQQRDGDKLAQYGY
jgi:hypothetical protein